MANTQNDTNKPVRFKASKRSLVSASVFSNNRTGEDGEVLTYHSVTLQAAYTDKNNTWKHSNSIPARDLDDALVALQKAKEHITSLADKHSHDTDEASSMPKLSPQQRQDENVAER